MKPDQLTKFLRQNGRIQPWLMRSTNELYETCVKSYYGRSGGSFRPLAPYRPEKKEQKLRRENKGPVRRLKTVERHREVTFKQSSTGNAVSRHLQGDQSAARAAAATSKNLLEAVMEANRRRSFSISFIRRNNENCNVLDRDKILDSNSPSCSSIDQSASDNGTIVPLAALMSKPVPPQPQPEPEPEPTSTPINRVSPESEMIFRAYGLSNRSMSMPPMKAPQRPNAYIEPPPRNQQSLGASCQAFEPLQLSANKNKFDFGDGGLMIVDAKLKQQLVMRPPSKPPKGVQFGYDPIDGVRFESVPAAYAFRSEKAHVQKEVKEQSRLRSLGDRIRQFQCIQFADGPVSNVNFNRRAQEQQPQHHSHAKDVLSKRSSLGVKVSVTKSPRSNPSATSYKSVARKSITSDTARTISGAQVEASDGAKASCGATASGEPTVSGNGRGGSDSTRRSHWAKHIAAVKKTVPSITSREANVELAPTVSSTPLKQETKTTTSQTRNMIAKAKVDAVEPQSVHFGVLPYEAVTGLGLSWPRTALEQYKNAGIQYDVATKSMASQKNIKVSPPVNVAGHVKLPTEQQQHYQQEKHHRHQQDQQHQQLKAKSNKKDVVPWAIDSAKLSLLMSERQMNDLYDNDKDPVEWRSFRVSLLSDHYRNMRTNSNWTCMTTTNWPKVMADQLRCHGTGEVSGDSRLYQQLPRTQQARLTPKAGLPMPNNNNADNDSNKNRYGFTNATTNMTTNGTNNTLPDLQSKVAQMPMSLSHDNLLTTSMMSSLNDKHQKLPSASLGAATAEAKQPEELNARHKAYHETKSQALIDERKFNSAQLDWDLCRGWSRKTQAQQSSVANAIAITQRASVAGVRQGPTTTTNQMNFSLAIEKFRQQRQQHQQKLQERKHQLQQQRQQQQQQQEQQQHQQLQQQMLQQHRKLSMLKQERLTSIKGGNTNTKTNQVNEEREERQLKHRPRQQQQQQQQQEAQQKQQTKQQTHAAQMSKCANKKNNTNNNKNKIYKSLQQQRKMSPKYQQRSSDTGSTAIATSTISVVAVSDDVGGDVVADGSSSGDNGRVVSGAVTTTNTLPEPTAKPTAAAAAEAAAASAAAAVAAATTTMTTKTTAPPLTASMAMPTSSTSSRHEVQRQYHYQSQKSAQFAYCMRIKPY